MDAQVFPLLLDATKIHRMNLVMENFTYWIKGITI